MTTGFAIRLKFHEAYSTPVSCTTLFGQLSLSRGSLKCQTGSPEAAVRASVSPLFLDNPLKCLLILIIILQARTLGLADEVVTPSGRPMP